MNEKYLWNRGGDPDPEIAQLEKLLEPLRYEPDRAPLQLQNANLSRASRRSWWWAVGIAAAAAVLILGIFVSLRLRAPRASAAAWNVAWNGAAPHAVESGQTIDTGRNSAAKLESEFIGEVRVDPNSRLRILKSTRDEQRLDLQHGTIHALIWAPPREFVVSTPSATTIDLGCQYTLHVGRDGTGTLNVEMGWVAFQWKNLESFIPAGAACITRPGRGPGTPYFLDAPAGLRMAVARFDETGDFASVRTVLASARPRDALTLWHLLSRTEGRERAEVFARFSEIVRLPPDVTSEKIVKGDAAAMDAAWNALNLGNTDWWREWKRRW